MACPTVVQTLTYARSGLRYSLYSDDFDQVLIPLGATRVRFSVSDLGSDFGSLYLMFRIYTTGGAWVAGTTLAFSSGGSVGPSSWVTLPTGASSVGFFFSDTCSFRDHCELLTAEATLEFDGVCSDVCEYGSEDNPDAAVYTVITKGLIEIIAGIALSSSGQLEYLPIVISALDAIVGLPFAAIDCSAAPPTVYVLDFTNPATLTLDNMLAWFRLAAWSFFCRCRAAPVGSPPPTVPDPPVIIPPPGGGGGSPIVPTPPLPPLTCDNEDICATLNRITQLLQSTNAQVSLLRRDVTLIQRQKVPFAYVHGVSFPGLSGSGELAVQGILGVSVDATAKPSWLSADMAPVNSWYRLGELSFGTVDGWVRRQVITHDPHLVLDIDGDITLIGYSFTPGVTANIQTLVREP